MIPIFDNGHGGIIGGRYQTPGKRSPNWDCGILYEGMFNRWVVNRLIEKMDRSGLDYYHVSPEYADVPLWQRKERVNKIHSKNSNTYLLSVHANAGGGEGVEGFTSPGETKSDDISEVFLTNLQSELDNVQKMRFDLSDGDKDKEARFLLLVETNCPAFLLECGFMDFKPDYHKLWSEKYLQQIVDSSFKSIQEIYKI